MDIRQQADREIDTTPDRNMGFPRPEDHWEAFSIALGRKVQGGLETAITQEEGL